MTAVRWHAWSALAGAALASALAVGLVDAAQTEQERVPSEFAIDFETSAGPFTIQVVRDWAPLGAARVFLLIRNGFYDGSRFFRVVPGFGVQFGISGDPAVSAAWRGARLGVDRVRRSNKPMFVTMAMGTGPDTRTTQLFINLADNRKLDAHGFAPLGWVTKGQDVVRRLYSGYLGDGAVEGGPEQWRMQLEGNAYLQREFPRLDHVIHATIRAQR